MAAAALLALIAPILLAGGLNTGLAIGPQLLSFGVSQAPGIIGSIRARRALADEASFKRQVVSTLAQIQLQQAMILAGQQRIERAILTLPPEQALRIYGQIRVPPSGQPYISTLSMTRRNHSSATRYAALARR